MLHQLQFKSYTFALFIDRIVFDTNQIYESSEKFKLDLHQTICFLENKCLLKFNCHYTKFGANINHKSFLMLDHKTLVSSSSSINITQYLYHHYYYH